MGLHFFVGVSVRTRQQCEEGAGHLTGDWVLDSLVQSVFAKTSFVSRHKHILFFRAHY